MVTLLCPSRQITVARMMKAFDVGLQFFIHVHQAANKTKHDTFYINVAAEEVINERLSQTLRISVSVTV